VQIDSIVTANENSKFEAKGNIILRKRNRIVGEGGFNRSLYYYKPEDSPRVADGVRAVDLIFIKGIYNESITYKDGHTEDIFAEFYYRGKLFWVRITQATHKEGKPAVEP